MATTTVSENQSEGRMPQRFRLAIASALVPGLCLALAGCARPPSEAPAAAPPPVTVSYPVEREVTDYADFTARTAAVDSVELRARVSGYLDKVNFKEGALVKKGDVLFEIDPRTYQAELKHGRGQPGVHEAPGSRGWTRTSTRNEQLFATRSDQPGKSTTRSSAIAVKPGVARLR